MHICTCLLGVDLLVLNLYRNCKLASSMMCEIKMLSMSLPRNKKQSSLGFMVREIITVGIGQCGNQIAERFGDVG